MVTDSSRTTRKQRRSDSNARRNKAREDRWKNERFAVPYRTERPTISLSVLWFVLILSAITFSAWAVAVVASGVAGIAGLQTGHEWARHAPSDRRMAAGFAVVTGLSGLAGTFGLGLACVILVFAAMAYSLTGVVHMGPSKRDSAIDFAGILVRSAVPAGVAAGSLVALTSRGTGAAVGLLLLVSAYEVGDYLVGSGSANAVEGPIAGLAALAVAGAGLALAQPSPFDGPRAILFAILTAACCPLGQVLGSAILPRGDAWAPGLRRLDSWLLAGPLWLLLL